MTIGTDERLLPCPFCGSDAFLKIECCCYVHCASCCVDGPMFDNWDEHSDGKREAAKLWNTRARTASSTNQPERELTRCADWYRKHGPSSTREA